MIDRVVLGLVPEKPHTALRAPDGMLLYEEMLTRDGFAGAFSYFYHRHPITAAKRVRHLDHGWPVARRDEDGARPLRRRLYDADKVPAGGALATERTPVFFNDQVVVWLARPTVSDSMYLADGDGDELWFIREGTARLESSCGYLDAAAGDYVFVPRGLVHRWHVLSPELKMLGLQGRHGFEIPATYRNSVGQLRMDAPYTHRDFVRPRVPIATVDRLPEGPRDLVTVRGGSFTMHELVHCPMDVVGWDGFVYPVAFAIEKFQPKVGLVHLPPTVHLTFGGSGVAVCSFVPRPLDFHPQAIPAPYAHANVQCDELIWYLRGEFTSRRGVGPGALSLHPAGIAHGPQPGAYETSIGATRTNELAVMIDAFEPLWPTPQAANIEVAGYHESWLVADAATSFSESADDTKTDSTHADRHR